MVNGADNILRIGVIGLVHGHAHQLFQQYQQHPEVQIVGVAESSKLLAEQYIKQYSLDSSLFYESVNQMLDRTRPQAVVLYTHTLDHRRMVEICAARGIAVMMEKPLAVSLEDARAIEKLAGSFNVPVLVNFETTWYASNHAVYELSRDGELGSIRKIVVHDGHAGPAAIKVGPEFLNWLTDPKLAGGGALFDFGCYGANLATWLLNGERPTSVTAVTQHLNRDLYPNVDDEATIILAYPKAQAIIQASWNWPYNRKDMEVYGTDGYAITVAADQVRLMNQNEPERQIVAKPLDAPLDHPLSMFKSVVLDGAAPDALSCLKTNVLVTEILEAARKSAATGTTVQLPSGRNQI